MLSIKKVPLVVSGLVLLSIACERDSPTAVELAGGDAVTHTSGGRAVVSTFDRGPNGWTLTADAKGTFGQPWNMVADFDPSAGNPGGAVFGEDGLVGITWFYQAPWRFLGNQQRMYGGTLQFDLKQDHLTDPGGGTQFGQVDVILVGAEWTLLLDAYPADPTTGTAYGNPGLEWTHYSIDLDGSAAWKLGHPFTGTDATEGQIQTVLKNLVVLRIRGEFLGGPDKSGLDNVRLVPPTQ